MPYRDTQKRRDYNKERMKKARQGNTERVAQDRVTQEDGIEYVPASYIKGLKGEYEFLPKRPRYSTLSDGQVLDRLNQPISTSTIKGMSQANDSYSGVMIGDSDILKDIINTTEKH